MIGAPPVVPGGYTLGEPRVWVVRQSPSGKRFRTVAGLWLSGHFGRGDQLGGDTRL